MGGGKKGELTGTNLGAALDGARLGRRAHAVVHLFIRSMVPRRTCTSREQAFDPRSKWALVPEFFAPGIRNTFSPGWCLQPGLKVPAPTATAPDRGGRDL